MILLEDSFSALPLAVVEGQRIISGMQDSLHLFLSRAMYMSIVVFGVAALGWRCRCRFAITPSWRW